MNKISFDIETTVTEEQEIVIAGIAYQEDGKVYCSYYHNGSRQLASKDALCWCIRDLEKFSKLGTIITWNGTGFDFRLLGEQSGMVEECARLALQAVDMMLLVTFRKGHYLGLDKALSHERLSKVHIVTLRDGTEINPQYLKERGKKSIGEIAGELWLAGEDKAVLHYLEGDIITPIEYAEKIDTRGNIAWTSDKGYGQVVDLDRDCRLQPVYQLFDLPKSYPSWITMPVDRKSFIQWMPDNVLQEFGLEK